MNYFEHQTWRKEDPKFKLQVVIERIDINRPLTEEEKKMGELAMLVIDLWRELNGKDHLLF